MSSVNAKHKIGRQAQLPLKRAFQIAFNSLRIRFWRSMITAAGIFLGIAFFTVVMTQKLMQWPVPQKIDAGFVRVDGQIIGPNDYYVWKRIPVQEGLSAGLPEEVVKRVAGKGDDFQLARVVQGRINSERAEKKLARLKSEWRGLSRIKSRLAFYIDVLSDKELKVSDAVKNGVPAALAKKAARHTREAEIEAAKAAKTKVPKARPSVFLGSYLADILREDSGNIPTFYVAAALDQDISIREAVRSGVPETVAKKLAGGGSTFKALALNDLITGMPDEIKKWEDRAKHYKIFADVKDEAVNKLDSKYAYTLGETIDRAKGFSEGARKADVMIVNKDRKISVDFAKNPEKAQSLRLKDGDYVFVPDLNSYYRMWWLIVMSLLVCTVGITNSMLMSVTERFKEIGTMKCLGALDSFVVVLFLLESGMMGIVASVLGWVAGFASITLIAGLSRGWDIVANIEPVQLVQTFGWSLLVGLLLTIVATIAPALRAAGMPAAVALRSEI